MSSRRTLNQTEGSSNPASKFLEWKSNDKSFAYYDKSLKEKIQVSIPFKFQFLEHFHTIKGWNDASESGVYSNEVKFISKEPLKVKAFKGGEIAEGLYSDIRSKIRDAGGKYYRSVYVVSSEGEIINLQFKGAVVSAYSDFMNEHEGKIESAWVEVNSAEDKKKGATKYSVPVFTIGSLFTKDELNTANEKYLDVANYFNKYSKEIEVEVEIEDKREEDIDF